MKTKLTALILALLPTISTPTFAVDEYIDNNDGTVTHTLTGLTWQRCSVGQTWDADFTACTGDAKTYNFDDAQKITSNFAGQSDWRVPTIDELTTIVDTNKSNPSINKAIFPQTPSNYFWSSSSPWTVEFGNGFTNQFSITQTFNVRLVRGSQWLRTFELKDFVDNRDGTVTHKKTGLTWQRCSVGQTWVDGGCDGTATPLTQTAAVALTSDLGGKTDWRLPTYRELQTIVDYSKLSPATNSIIFPSTPTTVFWSSTLYAPNPNGLLAWSVSFYEGIGAVTNKNNNNGKSVNGNYTNIIAARLVRGTLSTTGTPLTPTGSVDLVATLSASPSPAKINQTLTYTATVNNKGKANATGTTLTFYVAPKFMSYTSASNGCELKNNGLSVVCTIGDLASGANVTKTMNVIMQKSGGVSSSVLSKSNETDANPADNIGRTATGVKK